MNKRIRFFLASFIPAVTLFLSIGLEFNLLFKTILFLLVSVISSWWAAGLPFRKIKFANFAYLVLPFLFSLGYQQLAVVLATDLVINLVLTATYMFVLYTFFLIFNIFTVTQKQRTPALYRSAQTVSLFLSLLTAFLINNFIWSLRLQFFENFILFFVAGYLILTYHIWVIWVEGGEEIDKTDWVVYTLVPSLILAEFSVIFSFLPVGVFLASLYIVIIKYLQAQIVVAGITKKNVNKVYEKVFWVAIASVLAAFFNVSWR